MTGLASFFTLKHSLYDNMGNTTTRDAVVVFHVIVEAANVGEEVLVGEEVIDVPDEDESRSHAECSPKSVIFSLSYRITRSGGCEGILSRIGGVAA
jgi:hypothetical protein